MREDCHLPRLLPVLLPAGIPPPPDGAAPRPPPTQSHSVRQGERSCQDQSLGEGSLSPSHTDPPPPPFPNGALCPCRRTYLRVLPLHRVQLAPHANHAVGVVPCGGGLLIVPDRLRYRDGGVQMLHHLPGSAAAVRGSVALRPTPRWRCWRAMGLTAAAADSDPRQSAAPLQTAAVWPLAGSRAARR